MKNPDLLSSPPSFGIDPRTLVPSHTGGLLDLPDHIGARLRNVDAGSVRIREVALRMLQALARSDVPVQPYGPAAHLLELAEAAIRGDGRARYEGCRISLEEEVVFAGLYGLVGDPAEATVLLGATHLMTPDPVVAIGVAYGMVAVRRARYAPESLDAGCAEASRLFESLVG